jgi:IS30 family transposase
MKKHTTQRYEISALLQAGKSKSYIAKKLNVQKTSYLKTESIYRNL